MKTFNEIISEAGSRLHSAMLRENLLDELLLYFAPKILGIDGRGMFDLGNITEMNAALKFDIKQVESIGTDIRVLARPLRNN